jgi:hypothetical protein
MAIEPKFGHTHTHLSGVWIEGTKNAHSLQHFPLHFDPDFIGHQKLSKNSKQLGVLDERLDHAPRMRTNLAERAECGLLLLVRCLWVLQRADEQREDLADEGNEVFAGYAPEQTNAFDHVSRHHGLGIFDFGKEDIEEGVDVWFDKTVGGRKERSEHLSSYNPPLSVALLARYDTIQKWPERTHPCCTPARSRAE